MAEDPNHGFVCWNELRVHDVEKAMDFYSKTLGWTFEKISPAGFPYWIIKNGQVSVGGVYHMNDIAYAGVPERWVTYIAVDDVDRRLELALANGATAFKGPIDIPNIGRFVMIKEPNGALVGWMTPNK